MGRFSVFIFFISFLTSLLSYGAAFRVVFYPDRMRVEQPQNFEVENTLFLENKMLSPLRAKLLGPNGEIIAQFSLKQTEFDQKIFTQKKGDVFQLVPLIPSLQEAKLQTGTANYEIPAKR